MKFNTEIQTCLINYWVIGQSLSTQASTSTLALSRINLAEEEEDDFDVATLLLVIICSTLIIDWVSTQKHFTIMCWLQRHHQLKFATLNSILIMDWISMKQYLPIILTIMCWLHSHHWLWVSIWLDFFFYVRFHPTEPLLMGWIYI